MDRPIPNFFLYGAGGGGVGVGGGGGGGHGQPVASGGGDPSGGGDGNLPGSSSLGQPQQQQMSHDFLATSQSMMMGGGGGGGGASDAQAQQQALQFAGYPALMQQYFQQQQQQHQQQQHQAQQQPQQQLQQQMMDPRFAAFGNGSFVAGQGGGMIGMGGSGGASMGLNVNVSSMGMGLGMGMGGSASTMMSNVNQGPSGGAMGQAIGGYGLPGVGYVDNGRMMLSQGWGGGAAQVGYPGMMASAGGTSVGGGIAVPPSAGVATASSEVDQYAESGILGPWSATSAGLLGNMASTATAEGKGKKLRKKPKDRPKRPLSAYNIFFKEERARILEKLPTSSDDVGKKQDGEGGKAEGEAAAGEEDPKDKSGTSKRKKRPHGKIGFESLAKVIGQRWQELSADQVEYYKKEAEVDMKRYKQEMEVYLGRRDQDGDKAGTKNDGDEDDSERRVSKKMKSDPGAVSE